MSDRFLAASWAYQLALIPYALAGLGLAVGIPAGRRSALFRASLVVLALALGANTIWIVQRWIEADRPPFKTLYESLVFFSWCIGAVGFLLYGLHRWRIIMPFAAFGAMGGLLYGLARVDVEIVNLPPALQSGWFVPHVVVYFISYAGLFCGAVAAVLYLIWPGWRGRDALSDREVSFEEMGYTINCMGFTFLTLGLVMGAVWAKYAWGDYWTWDVKENWALITWFVYLTYLHVRFLRGWRGKPAAWFAVLGFAAVLFTYWGMHLLPTSEGSLHVYQ